MPSAKTRFPGGLTWRIGYPADVPAIAPIHPPPRLRVPILAAVETPPSLKPAGTVVSAGEKLTEAGAPAALAPVAGRIIGPCQVVLTSGRTVPAVELEVDASAGTTADPESTLDVLVERLQTVHTSHLPDWIELLGGCGISAERPTSPDLMEQLRQASRRPIDAVVCSLLQLDSLLPLNSVLAHRFPALLAAGVGLLTRLSAAGRGILVFEDQTPTRWRSPLDRAARRLRLMRTNIPSRYPQADTSLLLYALLKRRLRPGRLPVEAGVLLIDAAAAVAIGRCVLAPHPMLAVPLAICDATTGQRHYVSVPVGTPLAHVLAELKIAATGPIVAGNPLRQAIVPPEAIVAGADLVLYALGSQPASIPTACIRCGWCLEGCPTRLNPSGILEAAQEDDPELAETYGVHSCIECGICEYVCPAQLPLMQAARYAKAMTRREAP